MWRGWAVGEGRRILRGGCIAFWGGEGVEACWEGMGCWVASSDWMTAQAWMCIMFVTATTIIICCMHLSFSFLAFVPCIRVSNADSTADVR